MSILGTVVLLGAKGSGVVDEVRARKFLIVDNEGRVRGTLGMKIGYSFLDLPGGEPNALLELLDREGNLRVQLRGSGGGAGLDFFDSRGRSLMRLYLRNTQGSGPWYTW